MQFCLTLCVLNQNSRKISSLKNSLLTVPLFSHRCNQLIIQREFVSSEQLKLMGPFLHYWFFLKQAISYFIHHRMVILGTYAFICTTFNPMLLPIPKLAQLPVYYRKSLQRYPEEELFALRWLLKICMRGSGITVIPHKKWSEALLYGIAQISSGLNY